MRDDTPLTIANRALALIGDNTPPITGNLPNFDGTPAGVAVCGALVARPPARAIAVSTASASSRAVLLEAFGTINGFVTARLKGYLGFLAAARAGGAEHLTLAARTAAVAATRPVRTVSAAAVALSLACCATVRAATWFRVATRRVELLLAAGKHKILAAVAAGQRSIGRHRRRVPQQEQTAQLAKGRS